MKIKRTSVHVDQEKALRFDTEILGFVKTKAYAKAPVTFRVCDPSWF